MVDAAVKIGVAMRVDVLDEVEVEGEVDVEFEARACQVAQRSDAVKSTLVSLRELPFPQHLQDVWQRTQFLAHLQVAGQGVVLPGRWQWDAGAAADLEDLNLACLTLALVCDLHEH